MPVNAVALLERGEQVLILGELFFAGRDALIGDGAIDILADRLHIFGLVVGLLDHFGVGRKALEGAIEGGAGDAGAFGSRPEALDAFAVGEACAGDRHEDRNGQSRP